MNTGKYKAMDIANIFVDMASSLPGDSIDNMKLNKLCYYAQGWALAKLGYPLFAEAIEAWDYGPVVPSVYHTYKNNKNNSIPGPTYLFNESSLSSNELSLLVDVYKTYGKYTSIGLVSKTHEIGTPWRAVYREGENTEITQDSMRSFFLNSDELQPLKLHLTKDNVVSYV